MTPQSFTFTIVIAAGYLDFVLSCLSWFFFFIFTVDCIESNISSADTVVHF